MIELSKGEKVALKNEAPGSSVYNIGVSWSDDTDVDTALFPLDEKGVLIPKGEVSFKRMSSFDGALILDKDDRGKKRNVVTGIPRENARIDLSKLPANVKTVAFGAWVYTDLRTFGMVPDCACEVRDLSKGAAHVLPNTAGYKEAVEAASPVASFKLSGHKTEAAAYLGAFRRQDDGSWEYEAVDRGFIGGMETLEKFFEKGETAKKGGLFGGLRDKLGI